MKRGLALATLGLMLLSTATNAAEGAVRLKGFLRDRYPDLQTALERGIDATTGVQGAGGGFFPFAEADLNGDRVAELLVAYGSSYFSGSAGNYPIEIFALSPAGERRWLGRVWGREGRPLMIGTLSGGWSTIRFEKYVYCWKELEEGESPPETGYAGHLPQGGMYVYCHEK